MSCWRIRQHRICAGRFACKALGALVILVLLGLHPKMAMALPQGAQSIEGNVQFQVDGKTLNVNTQSQKSIAEYLKFNVNHDETVNFNLPGSKASILNRITGGNPSEILGKLNSNGNVFLVNPSGIIFGAGSQINVQSITASTLNIRNEDFMSGNLVFEREDGVAPASIVNQGEIHSAGHTVFLAGNIQNDGTIQGQNVHLNVGDKMTMQVSDSVLVDVTVDKALKDKVDEANDAVKNTGTIRGNTVDVKTHLKQAFYQNSVNNDGVIEAVGLTADENGHVKAVGETDVGESVIINSGEIRSNGTEDSPDGGEVHLEGDLSINTGTIEARGALNGQGGKIQLLGNGVALGNNATLDASAGIVGRDGGEILVGGDYQGQGEVRRAQYTYVSNDVQLRANAGSHGDGGKIIVWADRDTRYHGNLEARGGSLSGNGGLAEVSGKEHLYFYGGVDLTAANGEKGALLLDPENLYIMAPTLWLDASQIKGLTDGQAVSSWSDMSGNGYNATQGSGSAQPLYITNGINGQAVLRFDGIDDFITSTIQVQPDVSVFAVAKSNAPAWNQLGWITSARGGNGFILHPGGGTSFQSYILASTAGSHNNVASFNVNPVDQAHLYGLTFNDTTNQAQNIFDGTINATPTINISRTSGPLSVYFGQDSYGAGRFGNGDIAEILILNQALTGQELNLISQYMGNKYGITVPNASNTSVMTQSQIETLSQTANVTLTADKDITFGKLHNGVLNLQGNASLTITADADNNGTGNLTMNTADTLRTEGGNITLNGVNMTLGNLKTTGVASNKTGGSVNITATGDTTLQNITTGNANITASAKSIQFNGATISSNGGHIQLTGTNGTTLRGIGLTGGTVLNSAGGNITLNGTSTTQEGILLDNASQILSGNGHIQLTGVSNSGMGVYNNSNGVIQSGTGNITIQGTSQSGHGIRNRDFAVIQSSGGTVALTGQSNSSYGFENKDSAQVLSGGGTLQVNATSASQRGLLNDNATMNSAGGQLTLQGTSTTNYGIENRGGGTIQSGAGQMNLTGSSGTTYGIYNNAANIQSTTGNISLTSQGANNLGTRLTGGTFQSSSGNITLTNDRLKLDSALSTGGTVTIKPLTAKAIQLAGTTDDNDSALALDISNAELNRIAASTLNIGDANLASNVAMIGDLDLSGVDGTGGVYNLAINTGGSFSNTGHTLHLGRDALYFDGVDDFVNLGNDNSLKLYNGTIAAWVNSKNIAGNYRGIIAKQSAYGLFELNGKLASYNWLAGPGAPNAINSNAPIIQDNWQLVAFTFQNGVLNGSELWLNGSSVQSGTINISNQAVSTQIGYANAATQYFRGLIDNAVIYNRALTSNELQALYNQGIGQAATGLESGIVSGYSFSEGSGTSTQDITGTNLGNFSGAPIWTHGKNLTINTGNNVNTGTILAEGSDIHITAGNQLTVDGVVGSAGNGTVTMTATHNVTLNAGTAVQAGGTGNSLVLASTNGSFINNAGANTLQANNGRWLVYSDTPANTTEGGLTYNKIYNKTYAGNPPASIPAGNHILYSIAPVITVTADTQSRTYGDTNPTLTGTFNLSGLIDGDTALTAYSGNAGFTTTATQASDVGSYAITTGLGTLASSLGYQFNLLNGNLTVNKATLNVTANNQSRAYGNNNTPLTAAYSGFKLGENTSVLDTWATLSTPATAASNTGIYSITAAGAADNNYQFTYTPGTLSITPAPLTITANDAFKIQGTANPALSAQFNGFVLGQGTGVLGGQLALNTLAELNSRPGFYAITPSGLTSSNYRIQYQPGTLTVGALPNLVPFLLNANQSPNTVTPIQFQQQQQFLQQSFQSPQSQPSATLGEVLFPIRKSEGRATEGPVSSDGSPDTRPDIHTMYPIFYKTPPTKTLDER